MKLDDTFGQWVDLAKQRATVRLMDGREVTLIAVRKPSRNCKVQLGKRHYYCWIDDIALVQWPGSQLWSVLDAWPVVDLSQRPGVQITPARVARESRHWLSVTPNPKALHPSFQPASLPEPSSPEPSPAQGQESPLWLVPKAPPPTAAARAE